MACARYPMTSGASALAGDREGAGQGLAHALMRCPCPVQPIRIGEAGCQIRLHEGIKVYELHLVPLGPTPRSRNGGSMGPLHWIGAGIPWRWPHEHYWDSRTPVPYGRNDPVEVAIRCCLRKLTKPPTQQADAPWRSTVISASSDATKSTRTQVGDGISPPRGDGSRQLVHTAYPDNKRIRAMDVHPERHRILGQGPPGIPGSPPLTRQEVNLHPSPATLGERLGTHVRIKACISGRYWLAGTLKRQGVS